MLLELQWRRPWRLSAYYLAERRALREEEEQTDVQISTMQEEHDEIISKLRKAQMDTLDQTQKAQRLHGFRPKVRLRSATRERC